MRRFIGIRLVAGLAALALLWMVSSVLAANSPAQAPGPWQDIDPASLRQGRGPDAQQVAVSQGRYLRLDVSAMQRLLAQAPPERLPGGAAPAAAPAAQGFELALPMPDGSTQRFLVVESPIMAPELAARFPEIKTYAGQGLDDPAATLRLDLTPHGFHAMLLGSQGALYIDPLYRQPNDLYVAYAKADLVVDPARQTPELPPLEARLSPAEAAAALNTPLQAPSAVGTQLRTYRLAVAATGEYTLFHGGSQLLGQAAIVTAINRVNAIYEKEVAVRLLLVANNHLLVYTDPATDPYTNSSPYSLLSENQANLDAVLGSAAYDVGHVFSTGGGGLAQLMTPCSASKARGETGLSNPTGDAFWVDYVAHEMGHQFSAQHTFNGSTNACSGGNRTAAYAYEPGSGSTIMAYAGICGVQNLQPNSDAYFHAISFDQIVTFTTLGQGSSCAAITPTGNQPPTILSGSGGFTIPILTPFVLSGAASDPNGDPLTYQWEQLDAGPVAGAPPGVAGYVTPPHFRSFFPTPHPARIFPRLSDIVNRTVSIGEILPAAATTLHFRFTVRDNRSGGGGVSSANYLVFVSSAAGPFQVTAPSGPLTWPSGTLQNVTWNVANTDAAPVSCTNVDIRLSTDGGYTYPILLAGAVANDGGQVVAVPDVPTTTARVQVACANHIFFAISGADFEIQAGSYPDLKLSQSASPNPVYAGELLTYTLTAANVGNAMLAGVVITDTLPAQAAYVSDDAGCSLVSSGVLRCELADLLVGAHQSFQVVVQTPTIVTVLTNQAAAGFYGSDGSGSDENPADNQSSLDTTMLDLSDLNLKLSLAAPGPIYAGQLFTYTLTAANQSYAPLSQVLITDTLPAQVTYLAGSAGCLSVSEDPSVLRCDLGSLPARSSAAVTLQVRAPNAAMTVTNLAQAAFNGLDAYPADNHAIQETGVLASSDLALQLGAPGGPVFPAAPLTYVLTVTNAGPSIASGLTLTNSLPTGAGFIGASPGCSLASGQIVCQAAGLAPGAAQVYSLTLSAPFAPGLLVNQAQVGALTHDPAPDNNQAQASLAVILHQYFYPLVGR